MTNRKILLIINSVKKLFISVSGLFTYLTLPVFNFVYAQETAAGATGDVSICQGASGLANTLCNLGGANIGRTIRNIVVFFVILAVVIALLYLLYGGVKWITSRGEKTEVEGARNHIIAAIIGLIVVFLAVFILSIVLSAFGISLTELKIPTITNK